MKQISIVTLLSIKPLIRNDACTKSTFTLMQATIINKTQPIAHKNA